ncbi:hypothetical protein OSJ77_11285 [Phyllobacterium sp. 0TCS1.6C]|uniref:hypothetical protein n=1 Tax=unclassified Phyllobacterium TaxID=2638441 RepID=UPI00226479ED|nr:MULTISPECIES: hypothetical protein [unclassified Phyllobacterium]MCX8280778.1 hypothetical protein [Phyllobacterium sp. 0TCS1.6C]MCX8292645.1 hypothetical protein [Phyllobacterium sp. 0TCS1.6A]
MKPLTQMISKQYASAILCAALTAPIFCALYVSLEHNVYSWDARGYWVEFNTLGGLLEKGFRPFIAYLSHSVMTAEYNASSVAPIAPLYLLAGGGRTIYISAISLAYLLPLSILFAHLMNRIGRESATPTLPAWLLFATIVLNVPIWDPIVRGGPDVIGLIPICALIYYSAKPDTGTRLDLKRALLMGILIWLPFLFRRWYAYSVLALCFTAPILSFYLSVFRARVAWTKALAVTVVNYFIAGSAALLLMYLFQRDAMMTALSTDYTVANSAYQVSALRHLSMLLERFGILSIGLSLLSLGCALQNPRAVPFIILGWLNLLLTYGLFTSVQVFADHHYLPVAFWFTYLAVFGIAFIRSQFDRKYASVVAALAGTAIAAVFVVSFAASAAGISVLKNILPFAAPPVKVANIDAYQALTNELLRLTKSSSSRYAIFASSERLNDSMLMTLSKERLAPFAAQVSQIDRIDGISAPALLAKYVVLTNPIQTHRDTGQLVITLPASMIMDGTGIGKAYRRLPQTYVLEGVEAYIYEKTRPFSQDDVDLLLKEFFASYPEWAEKYQGSITTALLGSELRLGDVWGKFEHSPRSNIIFAHPGARSPTVISWNYQGVLTFKLAGACPGSNGVLVSFSDGKSSHQIRVATDDSSVEFDTSVFHGARYELVIDNAGDAACDGMFITEKKRR